MKEITYRCEICGDTLKDKTGEKIQFIGFEFKSYPKNELVVKHYTDVERHICISCLFGLSCIYQQIKSKYINEDV